MTGSAGQLCTKPGFLFVPAEAELGDLATQLGLPGEHRLLNPSIGGGFASRREQVLDVPGVTVLLEGSVREEGGQLFATPTVVEVTSELLASNDTLLEE